MGWKWLCSSETFIDECLGEKGRDGQWGREGWVRSLKNKVEGVGGVVGGREERKGEGEERKGGRGEEEEEEEEEELGVKRCFPSPPRRNDKEWG